MHGHESARRICSCRRGFCHVTTQDRGFYSRSHCEPVASVPTGQFVSGACRPSLGWIMAGGGRQDERWSSPSHAAGRSSGLSTLGLSTNFKGALRPRPWIEKKRCEMGGACLARCPDSSLQLSALYFSLSSYQSPAPLVVSCPALPAQERHAPGAVRLLHSWDQLAELRGELGYPSV